MTHDLKSFAAIFALSGIAAAAFMVCSAAAQPPLQDFAAPPDSSIPSGPEGVAIREGKKILTETASRLPNNVGNGLNCTSCHLNGGTTAYASPWIGIVGVFPEYRSRNGKMISLQDRINDCFVRSMNGKEIAYDSTEMNNILAYMHWLSMGIPTGVSVKGRGFGPIDEKLESDAAHGKQVYAEKCAVCHAPNGQGTKDPDGSYVFPPLWGMRSFNDGAGMARTYTAAAFVKHNMPLGQGGTLTDQEAVDVAGFFTHQQRPVYATKTYDYPKGDKPKDARN